MTQDHQKLIDITALIRTLTLHLLVQCECTEHQA